MTTTQNIDDSVESYRHLRLILVLLRRSNQGLGFSICYLSGFSLLGNSYTPVLLEPYFQFYMCCIFLEESKEHTFLWLPIGSCSIVFTQAQYIHIKNINIYTYLYKCIHVDMFIYIGILLNQSIEGKVMVKTFTKSVKIINQITIFRNKLNSMNINIYFFVSNI